MTANLRTDKRYEFDLECDEEWSTARVVWCDGRVLVMCTTCSMQAGLVLPLDNVQPTVTTADCKTPFHLFSNKLLYQEPSTAPGCPAMHTQEQQHTYIRGIGMEATYM